MAFFTIFEFLYTIKTIDYLHQVNGLLSSYIATGIENIPIFLRADNSEKILNIFLEKNN